jgi:hypothetical protein
VAGNYGYLADDNAGFEVLDLTNPANPVGIANYRGTMDARAVQLSGSHAYVAGSGKAGSSDIGGVDILAITNPESPARVGSYRTNMVVGGVDVAGGYAYLSGSAQWTGSNYSGGLRILNVSDPASPALVSSAGSSPSSVLFAWGVQVVDHYAYVAGRGEWTGSNFLDGLKIFDVVDPSHPVLIGKGPTTAEDVWGASVSGDHAYVANYNAGLEVLDVSDRAAPVRVGGIDTGYAFSSRAAGDYVYVTGQPSVTVVSVIDPANPTRVGSYDNGEFSRGIEIVGNYAYVANGDDGLVILEISEYPSLTLTRISDTLNLTWKSEAGLKLQRATSLANPDWADVPGSEGQSHFECPLGSGSEFFRLFAP